MVYLDGSWSGHTKKAYYLKWTGSGFEEYAAEEISIKELERYEGSKDIIRQIREAGYTVGSIYRRSNGILNINAVKELDSGRNYENVTLKLEGGRVQEVRKDIPADGPDTRGILEASSYGGIYQASGFHAQEERSLYEGLIAAARECALKNNGEKPRDFDFSSMLYMEKNWDYGTLGYLVKDLDGNGTGELIFGGNAGKDSGWHDGIIYDIYTISDGELVHVLSGWERSRYFLCENGMLAHEGSGSAFDGVKSYVTLKGAALQLEESVIWDYDRRRDARVYYYSAESEYDTKQASEITEEQAEAVMQKHAYERPVFMSFAS